MKRVITAVAKKNIPLNIRYLIRKIRYILRGSIQYILYRDKGKLYDPLTSKCYYVYVRRNKDVINCFNFSNSRQRLLYFYFLKNIKKDITKGFTILHIAPEYALHKFFSRIEGIIYIPADKKSYGYDYPSGTIDIDITNMQDIKSSSVDLFICNHVLEHIEDDVKAMSDIFRVLKNAGTAIITVPLDDEQEKTYENPEIIHPNERKKHFGQWDHVRLYGKDIVDKLDSAGFKVNLIKPAFFLDKSEIHAAKIFEEFLIIAIK
jgi:SAM-dependent methyltransferase